MKPETKTEDRVLYSQGWECIGGDSQNRYIHSYGENGDNGLMAIAKGNNPAEVKANAELIVKAVNERKALLDSHRELLDVLGMVRKHYNEVDENGFIHGSTPEFRNKIETAINNAKNI